jgi:pyroglutamyl-peptidase
MSWRQPPLECHIQAPILQLMTQPRLLICGFGAFPDTPRNPSATVIEALAAEAWAPPGVAADFLTLPVSWTTTVPAILDAVRAQPADGILVVGVATSADAFRVETLGRNRASRSLADQHGAPAPDTAIAADGPGVIAATAPVEALLQGIIQADLAGRLSDDAGDYLCNFTLYSLLLAKAAPAVGFLHVPQAREYLEGAPVSLADIAKAVRASCTAFAEALSRPDASRRTA